MKVVLLFLLFPILPVSEGNKDDFGDGQSDTGNDADVSIPVYLPLGDSLLDSSRHEDVSLQYDSDELEIVMNSFMCASTPKKYTSIPFEANYVARSLFSTGSNDSMDDKEVSFTDSSDTDMDAEYLGEIYATQKPVRSSNFLLSETSPKVSTLLKKALDVLDIKKTLKKTCGCGKRCLNSFSIKDVTQMRKRYWTKPSQSRSQYLLQTLQVARNSKVLQCDTGKSVCKMAFRLLLRINKNRMTTFNKKLNKGINAVNCFRNKDLSSKGLSVIDWLENYSQFHGDRMPHNPTIYLPYKTEKWTLFRLYKNEVNGHKVSKSTFYQTWKDYFPFLKIKQVNSFSRCNTCAFLDRQLEQSPIASRRAELRKLRQEHNQRQMMERKYYYSKREKSRKNPGEYLSLIIDGMDQSKSNLPHFTGRKAKAISTQDLLKTHISGVIDHSQSRFETYIDINQFPHDPNLTINIILQALKRIASARGNTLPPTLYLQADNCWRENKNKYVLSFCELLVRKEIFDEVHLSFLIVGHTHEDVDAGFSKISQKLRTNDCETLDELEKLLPNSNHLTHMFDVKAWLDGHLVDIQKHTQPLHFKFTKDEKNIQTWYKGTQDQPWKRMPTSLFKTDNGKPSLPKGNPKMVQETFGHIDFDRLKRLLKNLDSYFQSKNSVEWWDKFLSKLQKKSPKSEAVFVLDKLPKQKRKTGSNSIPEDIPEQIMTRINKEIEQPEVTTKNTKILKKRAKAVTSTKSQNKKKTTGKKRCIERRVMVLAYINLDSDTKRHIWLHIIHSMLDSVFLCVYICMILKTLLGVLLLMLMAGNILSVIELLRLVWIDILKVHVGIYSAAVCLPEGVLLCEQFAASNSAICIA